MYALIFSLLIFAYDLFCSIKPVKISLSFDNFNQIFNFVPEMRIYAINNTVILCYF